MKAAHLQDKAMSQRDRERAGPSGRRGTQRNARYIDRYHGTYMCSISRRLFLCAVH